MTAPLTPALPAPDPALDADLIALLEEALVEQARAIRALAELILTPFDDDEATAVATANRKAA